MRFANWSPVVSRETPGHPLLWVLNMAEQAVHRWQKAGFGLYVHWPFCQAKCPYCDFNSHVVAQIDQKRWLEAYRAEIRRVARETEGRVLQSIFFGGGTPSLMPVATVAGILEEAGKVWTFSNDIEITLEANPTSIEASRFKGYQSSGVNRVSIGVQALNDADLRRLGRMHSAKEAVAAIELAQRTFTRVSFDLIYARQHQSLAMWKEELAHALSFGTEHLSLYQLTIEPETVFGARFNRGQLRGLPNEDLSVDMYIATQEVCELAGMPAYEVSNHARPGAESRHNLIYWRCGDYVGVGPGAHGRLTDDQGQRWATETHKLPGEWLVAVESRGNGESGTREALSLLDQSRERLMMGLRLTAGFEEVGELERMGLPLSPTTLMELETEGFIEQTSNHIRPSLEGRLLLNSVIARLAP